MLPEIAIAPWGRLAGAAAFIADWKFEGTP
jgi:hypothetical protein